MIVRALTLAGGLTGAAGLSQFPEFSQQYTQRLGGAVDELSRVVADFDADAAKVGLSRDAALQELAQGSAMARERATTMARTFDRHARLSADLTALQGAGPFTRAYLATRMTDSDVTKRAWSAYRPAVPATFEGVVFAGTGFVTGILALGFIFSVLRMVFRRRRAPG